MMFLKKGFMMLSLVCSLSFLHAADTAPTSSITLDLSPSAADMYEIGFSIGMVDALNQPVQTIADNTYSLIASENQTYGTDNDNIYVYWKIIYASALGIYVDAVGPLISENSSENDRRLGWTLSVSDDNYVKVDMYGKRSYGDNSGYSEGYGLLIHKYSGRPSLGIGEAGSQKLDVETDDYSSKQSGTYIAQIKLSLISV